MNTITFDGRDLGLPVDALAWEYHAAGLPKISDYTPGVEEFRCE